MLLGILGAAMLLGTPIFAVLAGTGLVLFLAAGGPLAAVPHRDVRPRLVADAADDSALHPGGHTAGAREQRRQDSWQSSAGGRVAAGRNCRGDGARLRLFYILHWRVGCHDLALGGLLFPVLVTERLFPRFAVGLLTAAGSIGLLFPPSLPVILYGVAAHVPIDLMFIAACCPAC